jgi:hypothetical protein
VLPDEPHLLAVALVRRKQPYLLSHGRAEAPACCGFAQRCAYRLRVRQSPGAHDLESGGGSVIQPDMEGTRHARSVARIVLRERK